MICKNISLVAKNIKEKLDDNSSFPNELFKQPVQQDFEMPSYDQVPGYDPLEGINLKKIQIHPKDHPSYPHFCYSMFEVEITKWLTATSDMNDIKNTIKKVYPKLSLVEQDVKILLKDNDVKPELCACPKQNQEWFYGCKISACEFTEANPICLYRPRCKGCNYMFSYSLIQKHLTETPNCYEKYSKEAFTKLNDVCTELITKEEEEELKKRMASEESYFLAIKRNWEGWKKWFKEHNKTREDLKGKGRSEFLWVKNQWKKLQRQKKAADTNDDVDEEYERQMKDFETSNVADVEDAINQKKD